MITINLNELTLQIPETTTVQELKNKFKPDADIILLNGFFTELNYTLKNGDKLIFIKRGEIPSSTEMKHLITARHSPKVFEKLKNAKVAIAGLGGLGSHGAISLARVGVGKLKLVDFDIVEPSNLNRQFYNISQIGMKKTDALKENILNAVNLTEIETENIFIDEENISRVFSGFDAVMEAFDNPYIKTMFVEKMISLFPNTFIAAASGIAGIHSTDLFKTKTLGKNCVIVGDFTNAAAPGQGLMAPRVAAAANIQANFIVRYLVEKNI